LAVDTGLHLSFTGIGLGLAMMWGLHKALVVSHATARVHHAAWRRGGNEHFATCGACLEAPEVERGNRYSALRMTAKGQSRRFGDVRASSALALKADIHHKARHVSKVPTADSCAAANRAL
jgi:ribosomal protein L34E